MRNLALSVLAWMLAVAMVPLMIMALQGLHCADQAIVAIESARLHATVESKKARIEEWLVERTKDLQVLAAYPCSWPECDVSLADMSAPHIEAFRDLQEYVRARNPAYETIAVFDKHWSPVVASQLSQHVVNEDLAPRAFRERLEHATQVVIVPPHAHADGEIGIHVGMAMTNMRARRTGYLVAAIGLSDTVYPILSDRAGLRSGGRGYLITPQGRQIGKPAPDGSPPAAEWLPPPEIVRGTGEQVLRYRDCSGVAVLGVRGRYRLFAHFEGI